MKIFLAQIYCLFLLVLMKYKQSIGIIGMKMFLAQIYCLLLLVYDSKKLGKKCLMLCISLRLVDLNIYFCDVFFLIIKRVQKGVYI